MKTETGEEFLIARGGPFYELERQIGLVHDRAQGAGRRVIVFVCLAAVVPVILAWAGGGVGHAVTLLTAPEFLTRFILFIVICFQMEQRVEARLSAFLSRFDKSELLGDAQKAEGATLVARALKLRNSVVAEGACLVVAILASVTALRIRIVNGKTDWLMQDIDGQVQVGAGGFWLFTISSSIFWFLILRWLWRTVVWSLLLRWISRLDMRLVATHPDRTGGIAFIGHYPNAFAPLVFGLSAVVATSVYREIGGQTMDAATYGKIMALWLALVLVVFMSPLMFFAEPLQRLKETTLRHADRLDLRRQRDAERKVFSRNLIVPEDEAPITDEIPPDPVAFRESANALRSSPFSIKGLLPLSMAALAPMLIAGATQIPLAELIKIVKRLLFL